MRYAKKASKSFEKALTRSAKAYKLLKDAEDLLSKVDYRHRDKFEELMVNVNENLDRLTKAVFQCKKGSEEISKKHSKKQEAIVIEKNKSRYGEKFNSIVW